MVGANLREGEGAAMAAAERPAGPKPLPVAVATALEARGMRAWRGRPEMEEGVARWDLSMGREATAAGILAIWIDLTCSRGANHRVSKLDRCAALLAPQLLACPRTLRTRMARP